MFGDCFAEPVEIELGGFEPGRYRLHTYGYGPCGSAWAISVNLSVRNAANQNVYATEFAIQGPQFTGTWIGFPVAVSTLDLSPGYTIVAFVMAGSKCGLAGFQLEFQEPTGSISCLGDGTGAACPCSNFGLPGHGCRNSNSIRGAELGAVGSANLAADTLGLSCTFVLPNVTSVFLQGDQQIVPVPFGDGLRCAGGSLKRLFILNASGTGTVAAPVNGQPSVSERSAELGDPIPAGGTRFYQVYYRDPDPSFCPTPQGSTFNVSNAVELLWAP
jgi:hypothetical protein